MDLECPFPPLQARNTGTGKAPAFAPSLTVPVDPLLNCFTIHYREGIDQHADYAEWVGDA